MPLLNGIDAARQIHKQVSCTGILTLSTYHEDQEVRAAIASGAKGCIMKEKGSGNRGVGEKLGISIKTVEKHRQTLMNKLQLHEPAGLTMYAIAKGMIPCARPCWWCPEMRPTHSTLPQHQEHPQPCEATARCAASIDELHFRTPRQQVIRVERGRSSR